MSCSAASLYGPPDGGLPWDDESDDPARHYPHFQHAIFEVLSNKGVPDATYQASMFAWLIHYGGYWTKESISNTFGQAAENDDLNIAQFAFHVVNNVPGIPDEVPSWLLACDAFAAYVRKIVSELYPRPGSVDRKAETYIAKGVEGEGIIDGEVNFWVEWEGYPPWEGSWEPRAHIEGPLLAEWEGKQE